MDDSSTTDKGLATSGTLYSLSIHFVLTQFLLYSFQCAKCLFLRVTRYNRELSNKIDRHFKDDLVNVPDCSSDWLMTTLRFFFVLPSTFYEIQNINIAINQWLDYGSVLTVRFDLSLSEKSSNSSLDCTSRAWSRTFFRAAFLFPHPPSLGFRLRESGCKLWASILDSVIG